VKEWKKVIQDRRMPVTRKANQYNGAMTPMTVVMPKAVTSDFGTCDILGQNLRLSIAGCHFSTSIAPFRVAIHFAAAPEPFNAYTGPTSVEKCFKGVEIAL
jgi:hypothetical protein